LKIVTLGTLENAYGLREDVLPMGLIYSRASPDGSRSRKRL